MQTGDGGVCYQRGEVVNQNYQMCDVTNNQIRKLLGAQIPQVTFTCDAEDGKCDFQCKYLPPVQTGPVQVPHVDRS
jgi:ATP-binding cassette, subfamily G (WHITE), member 2